MKSRQRTASDPARLPPRPAAGAGMSLVEVTIAIGIASFVAITIMGLLTVALNNSTEASERAGLSRVYRNVSEAIKPIAAKSDPANDWQTNFCFTQDALSCGESDPAARYRVESRGSHAATVLGTANTNAWSVQIRIWNIARNSVAFERASLLIKEPPFGGAGGS